MDATPLLPPRLQRLWDALELRLLVLVSLSLQVVLIATGNRRKYSRRKWAAAILWLSYLSADSVATLALGVLSQAGGDSKKVIEPKYVITVFWAPFLLMHLGGPDTITAYALADNQLWSRHLLGLFSQVTVSLYIYIRSFTRVHLNFLWLVVFAAGVVKYGERSWVLYSASKDRYRNSMISQPDPGPNYAKFMDELVSREKEGYKVTLGKAVDDISTDLEAKDNHTRIRHAVLLQKAYYFFGTFKKLFADLILSFQDRKTSLAYFKGLQWEDAFEIVEIELELVFDLFYTKSSFIFSKKGVCLRLFSCITTISAFVAFLVIEKKDYPPTELIITHILLLGAIFLELYAVLILLMSSRMEIGFGSDRTWPFKTTLELLVALLECCGIVALFEYLRVLPARKRWSNSMGQYNVLDHCLEYMLNGNKVHWYSQYLEKYIFARDEPVQADLKEEVFKVLKERAKGGSKKMESNWKDSILLEEAKCFEMNDEVEFDQSLLVWQLATDICYYNSIEKVVSDSELEKKRKRCKFVSNYMVHLLIESPFMLPSGIGQIRIQDTCAEATEFFKYEKSLDQEKACKMLSKVDARFVPSDMKGDRSKSVFFDARRLAKYLGRLGVNERWEKISEAWVDMLTFAAAQCSWSDHAEKLSQGGELLTHVWLLMAHFGLTDQFQISKGYIRAKLELK